MKIKKVGDFVKGHKKYNRNVKRSNVCSTALERQERESMTEAIFEKVMQNHISKPEKRNQLINSQRNMNPK